MKNYIFFTFFILISCNTNNKEEKQIFRYNEHSNISSLDPAFARTQSNIWAVNQLFTGLVQLDDSLNIKPDIAKSWDISPDGKTYTFLLRNDVYFHKNQCFTPDSTRKVTAKDFLYSFSRINDEKTASPGKWIFQYINHFYAKNDSIFTIELNHSFPPFLGLLATKYTSVVPKEAIDFYKENFRRNPVGTGAFCFQLWEENTKLILRKNPFFYEKENGTPLPYLDGIAITFLTEKQSEFLQFIQGNLDFINSIDASYKDEILTPQGNLSDKYSDRIKMIKSPFLNTEYIGITLDNVSDISENEELRKAIHFGIDRKKMMKYLRNNIGIPASNHFIPKGLEGFSEQKISYNPSYSQNIVNNFIHKHQRKPKIKIASDANYLDICEFLQRELQQIGFQCDIDIMLPSTLRQNRALGKLETFRASWIADYPDAENYLSLFYSKNFAPNGGNYTHFQNNFYDNLYEKAINENSKEKRIILYQKMDSLIISHLPVIPLYYDENVRFIQKNIDGLSSNPINILQLKKVKKNPKNN
ncbi:MAG: ABC transporter substrate-binding protein [Capnocytophaga sp.]|nr:ABC transporter substrate-binding protein [Capnocytophaga sp.]